MLATAAGIKLSISCYGPSTWEVTNVYNSDLSYRISVNGVSFTEGQLTVDDVSASGEVDDLQLSSDAALPSLSAELFVSGELVDEDLVSREGPCLPTTPGSSTTTSPTTTSTIPCPMQPCLPITGGVAIPVAWLAGLAGVGFLLIFAGRRRKEEVGEKFSTDSRENGFQ